MKNLIMLKGVFALLKRYVLDNMSFLRKIGEFISEYLEKWFDMPIDTYRHKFAKFIFGILCKFNKKYCKKEVKQNNKKK